MENNKNKMPLISVITVVLNGQKYIEQAILSLKDQKYPNIEHIVMDGGSTDGTLEILKKYEGTYNLKWFSGKDNGAVDAVSKGFDMASGDIFCWLDADNFYMPGAIEKIGKIFQEHQEIDFVFGDNFLVDENSKIIGCARHTDFDFEIFLYLGMNINPQSAFWRHSLHKKMNGMNKEYIICSDWDFFLRMALSGAKFYHIRNFLSCYRLHSKQQTKNKEKMRLEGEKIFGKYTTENPDSVLLKWKRKRVLLKKAIKLIKQGDAWYVFKTALERLGLLQDAEEKATHV